MAEDGKKGFAVRHLHLEDLRCLPLPLPLLQEEQAIVLEVERLCTVAIAIESEIDGSLARGIRWGALTWREHGRKG